ncbi:thiosulfohydrolase SoxB [Gammaproteobacteria bacterium AH-315-K14]|nr:thiosulfohydrolase SoxB [Gammaproteobacteria bacterium AH-315-K14]
MNISRREFLQMLAVASAAGIQLPGQAATRKSVSEEKLYDLPAFGNVSLLHFTDCHAQLMPVWFREPNINIGIAGMKANAPHLVGNHFLTRYGINPNSPQAHAFTYLNFVEASKKFGKIGGFSHLATLIKHIQAQRPDSVLLDGGDTWQGSATSLWTDGQDMVDATKLLGVDAMTGHWEFTFGAKRVKEIIEKDLDGHMDFLAQNVIDNQWEEDVFKPYVIKEINGIPTAIVGQAFPYTPIANPRYMVPDWSFGIREDKMQQTVDAARKAGAQVVVLLSHNGMDVDLKMASRVVGIDAIMGGHTHDAVPEPVKVKNNGGITLVINSGSNSKFLSVLDFDVRKGKVRDFRYSLLPIFSNLLEPDVAMSKHIENVRKPYIEDLEEELGIADELLYRSGYQTIDPQSGIRYLVLVDGYRYQGLPGSVDFKIHQYEKNAVRLEEMSATPLRRKHWSIPTHDLWDSTRLSDMAELQWRFAMPLATVLLALLAVMLSRTSPRQGRFAKLFVAILIFVTYYNTLGVSMSWVQRGVIAPALGLWWVHGVLAVLIGILAIRHWGRRWVWQRFLIMLGKNNQQGPTAAQ